jgi:hypothetical protein
MRFTSRVVHPPGSGVPAEEKKSDGLRGKWDETIFSLAGANPGSEKK